MLIYWNSFTFFCFFLFSFICLHHRGYIYKSHLTNEIAKKKEQCLPWIYYVKGIDKWETSDYLGLVDIILYNILTLLALPPSSSIMIKMLVTLGSIVSVQVGSWLTYWLCSLVKIISAPGVPLPVITFSIYLFVLNIIMPTNLNECVEL